MKQTNIGIIGCGNIAHQYADTLMNYDDIKITGVYDLYRAKAEEFTQAYGGQIYETMEALLNDDAIDIVVNLTIPQVHGEINRKILQAGKNVYTEKPIAMTYEESKEIVDLAIEKGLTICSSPITFLGDTQTKAAEFLKQNKTGDIKLIAAEMHNGMFEHWHPNPTSLYDVGVLYDVGIYPITYITYLFGPAVKVKAFGNILIPDRVDMNGQQFKLDKPDYLYAEIELANGILFTLTASFLIDYIKRPATVEFVGDKGVVKLGSSVFFRSPLEYANHFEPYTTVVDTSAAYDGVEWCRGLVDMARAVREGFQPKADPSHAVHVVEILEAIQESIEENQTVELSSTFQVGHDDYAKIQSGAVVEL